MAVMQANSPAAAGGNSTGSALLDTYLQLIAEHSSNMAAAAAAKRNREGGPRALAQGAPPTPPAPPPPHPNASTGTENNGRTPTKRTRSGTQYGGRPKTTGKRKHPDN